MRFSNIENKIVDWLARPEKAPVRARTAEEYRKDLFPEFYSEESLLQYLSGKTVADIGSGATHKNPYSLANVIIRHPEKHIKFFGIEPKVGVQKYKSKISRRGFEEGLMEHLNRFVVTGFSEIKRGTPAEKNVISAKAENLPIAEGKLDLLLSDYFFPLWVGDDDQALTMLMEFTKSLKLGGEIRLGPISETNDSDNSRLTNRGTPLGDFLHKNFAVHHSGHTLILRKDPIVQDKE